MSATRCRICLQPLDAVTAGAETHPACARELFRGPMVPRFPYRPEELQALAENIVRRQVSVPGVQPKLSLHLDADAGGRLTLVDMEGEYILKPPSALYPELPELEHLTLRMAGCFSIPATPCGLIAMEGGDLCLIMCRMDREDGRKLAMEDLCQLSDRLTEDKYRASLEKTGQTIRRYSHLPGLDAVAFFDLALYCFLTGNADMHLKNFSLLTGLDGQVRLAPAYDLVPTALVLPADREETALTINGKKSRLTWADFVALGKAIGLTPKQTDNALARLHKGLPAALALLEAGFLRDETRGRYRDLLGQRLARLGPEPV